MRRDCWALRDGIRMRYAEEKSFGSMQRPLTRAAHLSLSEAVCLPALGRNSITNVMIVATMMAP
jgi:hypothetical protein